MYAWIVYDITKTRRRNKIIKHCKDFGLIRAQKSVFVGLIDEERVPKFKELLTAAIDTKCDSVFLLQTTRTAIDKSLYLGITFDKKLAMREYDLIFF